MAPMAEILEGKRVPVKIWTNDTEEAAKEQLLNVASLPFIHSHVAAMPDVHYGRGATIGSVIATKGAIIPSAVGVDIGCGMTALRLPFKTELLGGSARLASLRHSIERSIPVGNNGNKETTERTAKAFMELGANTLSAEDGKNSRILRNAACQLGSLGGGNHFIEICTDQYDDTWIMLHSGSRNIGKHLAERHIEKAKELMKLYFISLPDPELAYLAQGTPEFHSYLMDLVWAQGYAKANRLEMMRRVVRQVSFHLNKDDRLNDSDLVGPKGGEAGLQGLIDCHHNYTEIENHFGHNVWVTRKGAVRAREGDLGIIPGSMGTGSFIVKGKGNAESFCSCSHGAGRKMSRTKARAAFTASDLASQTAGVECRKDEAVVDEIPGAYKDVKQVMAHQSDLVDVLYSLKQIICIKG